MKLHKFNDLGLQQFNNFLDALAADPAQPIPAHLLCDGNCVVQVAPAVEVDCRRFTNRMQAAAYLDGVLECVTSCDVARDVGLWAWLTLCYFDQVCPVGDSGRRKPSRERTSYIPSVDDYRKYYRHRLLGPYVIFRAHRDNPNRAIALLFQDVSVHPDVAEQIFGYQELAVSHGVVALASRLYFDAAKGKTRRGIGSKTKGGPRRLSDMMNQFGVTWDLQWTSDELLATILPKEFDRFRAPQG